VRMTVKLGSRERFRPSVLEATPMGALPTEAVVEIGAVLSLSGPAAALRALATAAGEAAAQAELYDADPAAYRARQAHEQEET
jgi:hypothetical protein